MTIPSVLDTIVSAAVRRVEVAREAVPLGVLEARVAASPTTGRAARAEAALRGDDVRVIAECKRRSPSKGVLRASYDPVAIATAYERAGAAAISVLTEPAFFDGALDHLEAVRAQVQLPVLRKDFTVDAYQIAEAKVAGADLILLIVAALDQATLEALIAYSAAVDVAALVEVHDEAEARRAVDAGARIIGVNNRNLKTLEVSLDTSYRVVDLLPASCFRIAESGLRTGNDIAGLLAVGFDAFLMGERFMTDADPGDGLARVRRDAVAARAGDGQLTRVKVCGLTNERDAELAARLGAAAIGMVFWPGSPRAVTVAQARRIVQVLPPLVQAVGVFVNTAPQEVYAVADAVGLDLLQLHGDECVDDWAEAPRPIIKALTLASYPQNSWIGRARAVLLDAHDPVRRGGTGAAIDWTEARRCAGDGRFVLAGGLTADNVGRAIDEAVPAAVDVSSGVEASPGQKDPGRLRAFL